jgi:hypothetical protein
MAMQVRIVGAVAGLMAFGWALVVSADARHEAKPVVYETVVQLVEAERTWVEALEVPTPIADSLLDMDEVERQTDCLWEFMQAAGVEITLQTVMAAGTWTDALGGACLVIGEDDE